MLSDRKNRAEQLNELTIDLINHVSCKEALISMKKDAEKMIDAINNRFMDLAQKKPSTCNDYKTSRLSRSTKQPKMVGIKYDEMKNIVYFDCYEDELHPRYIDYMLEYAELPKNAVRKFRDRM